MVVISPAGPSLADARTLQSGTTNKDRIQTPACGQAENDLQSGCRRAFLLLRRWGALRNLLSDVFGHHVALSFVVTDEEKLNSSVATEVQKNTAS